MDFGTAVIGETLKRSITLSNLGGLGTKFDFFKVTGELLHCHGNLAVMYAYIFVVLICARRIS